jgi:GNAT superfamily N-acetyltransferase
MNDNDIAIRLATAEDIPDVIRLRRMMFEAMGYTDPAQLDAADQACIAYFSRAIPAGEYLGWLAVTDEGQTIASGGVCVDVHPPGPNNPEGRIAYIMNMCTEPAYRRRGLARRIFDQIMQWVQRQGIHLASLHATDLGKILYTQYGFKDSNEMRARM